MTKINSVLIEAATNKIISLYNNSNIPLSKVIQIVKEEYELNEEETDKINDILSDDNDDNDDASNDIDTNNILDKNDYIIYFNDEDELSDAIGRLMYNRIPWEEQSSDDRFYIKFKNDVDLTKAIKILSKYDFISDKDVSIAVINFDNIDDFKKVMSFIKKNEIYYDIKTSEDNFSDTIKTPTEFDAISKRKNLDLNYDEDSSNRIITVRKKW